MFERIRPVIVVVENSTETLVQKEIDENISHITDWINRKTFMGSNNRGLVADIFQFPSSKVSYLPNIVKHSDLKYIKEEICDKKEKKVCLDPLFDYLVNLEFLNNKFKYVQPIVIFAMEGSKDYIYDERKFLQFRKSYIYSNALRIATYGGKPLESRCEPTKENIEILKLLTNKNKDVSWEEFRFLDPHTVLIQAFIMMENVDGDSGCIEDHHFPKDCVIKNGKICWVKTKSIKRILKWLKQIKA